MSSEEFWDGLRPLLFIFLFMFLIAAMTAVLTQLERLGGGHL